MMFTSTQVITIELVILIIYFFFKDTRKVRVMKRNDIRMTVSEYKKQKTRMKKQKAGVSRKEKLKCDYFEQER